MVKILKFLNFKFNEGMKFARFENDGHVRGHLNSWIQTNTKLLNTKKLLLVS